MQYFAQRFRNSLPVIRHRQPPAPGQVLLGDCIPVMESFPGESVDFILTDPPYITRYRDRTGRTVANDNNDDWLIPAFAQMYRLLRPAAFCVSFYGWNKVDCFMAAWRAAGFRPIGHIVFRKPYTSKTGFFGRTARGRLSARQRQCRATGAANPGCARLALYWQPAPSDAETRGADAHVD